MTLEQKFQQLIARFLKAEEYCRNKYLDDTSENQERAEKALKQVIDRMNEIWEQMDRKEREKFTDLFD